MVDVNEWVLRRVYSKFERMYQNNEIFSIPTLLPGDLESGQAYMLQGNLLPMAMKKLKNVIEYHSIYPEFSHIFIGDNGQADVKVAEMLKERFGDTLEASFIHEVSKQKSKAKDEVITIFQVQPLDRTFGYDKDSLKKWSEMGIIFFKTYIGAAVKGGWILLSLKNVYLFIYPFIFKPAAKLGLLSQRGLKRVCIKTVSDFTHISPSRFHGGLLKREERRIEILKDLDDANALLLGNAIAGPLALCLFPVGR